MKDNPFLDKTNIADNINHSKKDVTNPFIVEKEKEIRKVNKNRRKSILFYQDDYNKIVALSKTNGETITGLINNLIDEKITNLNELDKERYEKFLN